MEALLNQSEDALGITADTYKGLLGEDEFKRVFLSPKWTK
jgi:hypothetical protein